MTEPGADRPNKALPGNNRSNRAAVDAEVKTAPPILNALYAEKKSWRAVAEMLPRVSPALAWKVAHEQCESTRVNTALGLTEKRWRFHYECGHGDTGAELDATIRAEMASAGCDSFSDYVDYLRGKIL